MQILLWGFEFFAIYYIIASTLNWGSFSVLSLKKYYSLISKLQDVLVFLDT
jgi:hypothetical protein